VPPIRAYAAANKIELVSTPTYASYLNPVECHFSALTSFVARARQGRQIIAELMMSPGRAKSRDALRRLGRSGEDSVSLRSHMTAFDMGRENGHRNGEEAERGWVL
jgi:hypothetical protein